MDWSRLIEQNNRELQKLQKLLGRRLAGEKKAEPEMDELDREKTAEEEMAAREELDRMRAEDQWDDYRRGGMD